MSNIFIQSLHRNFSDALRQLEQALRGCPESLWAEDLWPDEAPTTTSKVGSLRGSAPWLLAHHALICLDYDLAGELEPWQPPSPISDFVVGPDPTRVFTKPELLAYLDHCRTRVGQALDAMTEFRAEQPLPEAHRYRGAAFGVVVGSIPVHLVEHATQIRQFCRSPHRDQRAECADSAVRPASPR